MRDRFDRFDRGEPGVDLELSRWAEERPFWQYCAVVYAALAVESWMNFYGLRKLGPDRFRAIERVSPPRRKLRLLFHTVGVKRPSHRATICKAVDRLFGLRNDIVHSKSGEQAR